MVISKCTQNHSHDEEVKEERSHLECKQLLESLPRERGWRSDIYLYQRFWCQPKEIQAIISFQHHFLPQETDIILASIPKTGTTWLKALVFAIVNRNHYPISNNHPLITSNPHTLVPFFEYKLYADDNQLPDLSDLPQPRLFATHIPFESLPARLVKSKSRIVYVCRNPLDTFVSMWHFMNPKGVEPFPLEEAFDKYCRGIIGFGPTWTHMLGYWNESQKSPQKVLFLKYEDMKEDICTELKKLGEFLGFHFSLEEEKEGVIEEIAKLCSFENLKELKVNQNGNAILNFENKALFRKGVVGDWANLLTPSMVERLSKVMVEKLAGSGLEFKFI